MSLLLQFWYRLWKFKEMYTLIIAIILQTNCKFRKCVPRPRVQSSLAGCRLKVSAIYEMTPIKYAVFLQLKAQFLDAVWTCEWSCDEFEHDAPGPFRKSDFESVLIAIIMCTLSFWALLLLGLRRVGLEFRPFSRLHFSIGHFIEFNRHICVSLGGGVRHRIDFRRLRARRANSLSK